MEDVRSTSSSTSTSGSSSSGSDEGSDEDDTHADADGELVPSPPRAGIPALETAAADSSVAYKPGKPAVPSCRVMPIPTFSTKMLRSHVFAEAM